MYCSRLKTIPHGAFVDLINASPRASHCFDYALSIPPLSPQNLFTLLLYARISRSFFNLFNLSFDSSHRSWLHARFISSQERESSFCASWNARFNRLEKWNDKEEIIVDEQLNRTWGISIRYSFEDLYGRSSFSFLFLGREGDSMIKSIVERYSRGLEQHKGDGEWKEGKWRRKERWKATTSIPWNV